MVTYDFDGRVAFVTGAARGIGRAIARRYAEAGADVVVTDICEDDLAVPYDLATEADLRETAELVEDAGVDALPLCVDVRDAAEIERAMDIAVETMGRIDVLATNAGVWDSRPLVEMDEATFDAVVETNLRGSWLPAKHFARHVREREGGGRIVTTASVGGLVGTAGSAHYAAAMHGVVGLTKSLAVELGRDGITANAVCPTGVDTPMLAGMADAVGDAAFEQISDASGPMNVLDGDLLSPEDVAEAFCWLSSDAARYVTGVALPVDAGMTSK
ncbi:SDR family oxidoreductase [Haloarculaceae archaeon H-GB11]|nr:SDR family oxidoreductase [Haloarculaceae archaeon H-GB11]